MSNQSEIDNTNEDVLDILNQKNIEDLFLISEILKPYDFDK